MRGFLSTHNLEAASMYIDKRWIVPATLCLLLLSTLCAVVVLLLGTRFPAIGSLRAEPIATTGAQSRVLDPPCFVPAGAATATPDAATAAPATPRGASSSPEEVVDIDTSGSEDAQITTRGFGDIGMQFQGVDVNAPITNVHISNEGNNNSNNVVIGDDGQITSDQQDLQSNRSDPPPPAAVSTVAATPEPASVPPTGAAATLPSNEVAPS